MSLLRPLARILPEWAGGLPARRTTHRYNPNRPAGACREVVEPRYQVFAYDGNTLTERDTPDTHKTEPGHVTWINMDGLNRQQVEQICGRYQIHSLAVEDILSTGQRAKMDELDDAIFLLLPMLVYNKDTALVDAEQISIVMGRDYVLSFQEDARRDAFDRVRAMLRKDQSRLRKSSAELLAYSLVDAIVDNYFEVIEELSDRIERVEDAILDPNKRATNAHIALVRREVMVLSRAILPVRELIGNTINSESPLLAEANLKYWRDVRDHIIQASEYSDNLREMIYNLQNALMSQINLRMNEVMKVFTMVTTLLAPAAVIGGIYGMNFTKIPMADSPAGFWVVVCIMLAIPVGMLVWFKRKGWF